MIAEKRGAKPLQLVASMTVLWLLLVAPVAFGSSLIPQSGTVASHLATHSFDTAGFGQITPIGATSLFYDPTEELAATGSFHLILSILVVLFGLLVLILGSLVAYALSRYGVGAVSPHRKVVLSLLGVGLLGVVGLPLVVACDCTFGTCCSNGCDYDAYGTSCQSGGQCTDMGTCMTPITVTVSDATVPQGGRANFSFSLSATEDLDDADFSIRSASLYKTVPLGWSFGKLAITDTFTVIMPDPLQRKVFTSSPNDPGNNGGSYFWVEVPVASNAPAGSQDDIWQIDNFVSGSDERIPVSITGGDLIVTAGNCADGIQNNGETGADCGGSCSSCGDASADLILCGGTGAQSLGACGDIRGDINNGYYMCDGSGAGYLCGDQFPPCARFTVPYYTDASVAGDPNDYRKDGCVNCGGGMRDFAGTDFSRCSDGGGLCDGGSCNELLGEISMLNVRDAYFNTLNAVRQGSLAEIQAEFTRSNGSGIFNDAIALEAHIFVNKYEGTNPISENDDCSLPSDVPDPIGGEGRPGPECGTSELNQPLRNSYMRLGGNATSTDGSTISFKTTGSLWPVEAIECDDRTGKWGVTVEIWSGPKDQSGFLIAEKTEFFKVLPRRFEEVECFDKIDNDCDGSIDLLDDDCGGTEIVTYSSSASCGADSTYLFSMDAKYNASLDTRSPPPASPSTSYTEYVCLNGADKDTNCASAPKLVATNNSVGSAYGAHFLDFSGVGTEIQSACGELNCVATVAERCDIYNSKNETFDCFVTTGFNQHPPIPVQVDFENPLANEAKSDFNGDGVVDSNDFMLLYFKLGTTKDTAGYDPFFDLNEDGSINDADETIFHRSLGFDATGNFAETDFTFDHRVDYRDYVQILASIGLESGDPEFQSVMDLDDDLNITYKDVTRFVATLGIDLSDSSLHYSYADYTASGRVDFDDFLIMLDHYGSSGTSDPRYSSMTDHDADSDVDHDDMYAFVEAFGAIISWSGYSDKIPDFNDDLVLDVDDLVALEAMYGKSSGQSGYNETYDIVDNNVIDEQDFLLFHMNMIQILTNGTRNPEPIVNATSHPHALADFNGDLVVNEDDFTLFVPRFGETTTSPGWNATFELDVNGRIDFTDFMLLADAMGYNIVEAAKLNFDYNGDRKLDVTDFWLLFTLLGVTSSDPAYDSNFDANSDNSIDGAELFAMIGNMTFSYGTKAQYGRYDLTNDGVVNHDDLSQFIGQFGKTNTSLGWQSKYDYNRNGQVESGDFFLFVGAFGKSWIDDRWTNNQIGDFDNDNDIDTADYTLLNAAMGGSSSTYDIDNSGTVDISDVRAIAQNIGIIMGQPVRGALAIPDRGAHPKAKADFNGDFIVDFNDMFAFVSMFGKSCCASPWNGKYDLHPDGIIDDRDFDLFVEAFGFIVDLDAKLSVDYSGDGILNLGDILIFQSHYGKTIGDPDYILSMDINSDMVIDFKDFFDFGEAINVSVFKRSDTTNSQYDLDADGLVEEDDFHLHRHCHGQTSSDPSWAGNCTLKDYNSDNVVDFNDFFPLAQNFGNIIVADADHARIPDFDGNNLVDTADEALYAATFGSSDEDQDNKYNSTMDINNDGFVNWKDSLVFIAGFATGFDTEYPQIQGVQVARCDTAKGFTTRLCCDDNEEICDNGIDDDGDTLSDCADPDCANVPSYGDFTFATQLLHQNKADFDGDNLVGFSDFFLLAHKLGSTVGDADFEVIYDLDSDGVVEQDDIDIFISSFGYDGEKVTDLDMNQDKSVDRFDFLFLLANYGVTGLESSDAGRWDARMDLNDDSQIDYSDLFIFLERFGFDYESDPSMDNSEFDHDKDGLVDEDDFSSFVPTFGAASGDANFNISYDYNNDGVQDFNDFFLLVGAQGKAAGEGDYLPLVPDFAELGTINKLDLVKFEEKYLLTSGSSGWNASYDITGDNVINDEDARTFFANVAALMTVDLRNPVNISNPATHKFAASDFNGDGIVDMTDFNAPSGSGDLVSNFGLTSTDSGWNATFDLDGDLRIDFDDFMLFVEAFGYNINAVSHLFVDFTGDRIINEIDGYVLLSSMMVASSHPTYKSYLDVPSVDSIIDYVEFYQFTKYFGSSYCFESVTSCEQKDHNANNRIDQQDFNMFVEMFGVPKFITDPDTNATVTNPDWNATYDYNSDNAIDFTDFFDFVTQYGKIVVPSSITTKQLGDFNGDNKIDDTDSSLFASAYGGSSATYDVNNDGTVDGEDVRIIVATYTSLISRPFDLLADYRDKTADERSRADFNNDFLVDSTDYLLIEAKLDTTAGGAGWDARYDLVADQVIDSRDFDKFEEARGYNVSLLDVEELDFNVDYVVSHKDFLALVARIKSPLNSTDPGFIASMDLNNDGTLNYKDAWWYLVRYPSILEVTTHADPVYTADINNNKWIEFNDFYAFSDAFNTVNETFDFDNDNLVDFDDFGLFADAFGKYVVPNGSVNKLPDLNGDSIVNSTDKAIFDLALGTSSGDAGWDPDADVDGSGTVTASDAFLMMTTMASLFDPTGDCSSSGKDVHYCCIIQASDEDCTNGVDDDADGFADCADPDCNWLHNNDHQNAGNNPIADTPDKDQPMRCDPAPASNAYNYTWQDGNDYLFYCSYGRPDDGDPTDALDSTTEKEAFCCPSGMYAQYDPFTFKWSCEQSDPCHDPGELSSGMTPDTVCPFTIDEDELTFFTDIDCFCPKLCVNSSSQELQATDYFWQLPDVAGGANRSGLRAYCDRILET